MDMNLKHGKTDAQQSTRKAADSGRKKELHHHHLVYIPPTTLLNSIGLEFMIMALTERIEWVQSSRRMRFLAELVSLSYCNYTLSKQPC